MIRDITFKVEMKLTILVSDETEEDCIKRAWMVLDEELKQIRHMNKDRQPEFSGATVAKVSDAKYP